MRNPATFTVRDEFETVLADGREVSISFDRVTTYSHDAHYGADADGRRGMPMTFIDDDEAARIVVTDADNRLVTDASAEARTLADAYIAAHDPTPPDDGPDEPDYDDIDD